LYDKNSGRSRGFGFVNFSIDQEAKSAKDAMDGKVRKYYMVFLRVRIGSPNPPPPKTSTPWKHEE